MKQVHFFIFFLVACIMLTCQAFAGSYNYISAEALKAKLEKGEPVIIIDIQTKEDFSRHHLPGAIATHAYPVKTVQDKAKIDAVLDRIRNGKGPVVIVCPRGAGGAQKTFDHLIARKIPANRLFILKNGQEGWPYPEFVEGR
ncbi:hypothetical protein DBT_0391 [Dissulfuribacter thermophilus]|uniref:Rhodanese domain-containing protein n=1 Tax=Dissulfuribacter thermophilus TaxID=1156395 RepID=A0A1B9F9L5_9BACT|nr:rhodanese-like domain-containing protein [Dissulfuribacter thermophilus]OCC16573.1 hypothetical protein DBT_0391 [Dissulfuribacter thermophilus]